LLHWNSRSEREGEREEKEKKTRKIGGRKIRFPPLVATAQKKGRPYWGERKKNDRRAGKKATWISQPGARLPYLTKGRKESKKGGKKGNPPNSARQAAARPRESLFFDNSEGKKRKKKARARETGGKTATSRTLSGDTKGTRTTPSTKRKKIKGKGEICKRESAERRRETTSTFSTDRGKAGSFAILPWEGKEGVVEKGKKREFGLPLQEKKWKKKDFPRSFQRGGKKESGKGVRGSGKKSRVAPRQLNPIKRKRLAGRVEKWPPDPLI